jgi:hypothetical protein
MFRRSIFLGLMVLLGSVLVYMVLSARRQEKRISSPPAEIVRQSKPSATRVLAPEDLQVADSSTKILPPSGGSGTAAEVAARHSVTVRNAGKRHYRGFMLRFDYSTASGRSIESRSREISQDVPPGGKVAIQELLMEGLPDKVKHCIVRVAWADLVD